MSIEACPECGEHPTAWPCPTGTAAPSWSSTAEGQEHTADVIALSRLGRELAGGGRGDSSSEQIDLAGDRVAFALHPAGQMWAPLPFLAALLAALRQVSTLHQPQTPMALHPTCAGCAKAWPCPTVTAIVPLAGAIPTAQIAQS